MYVAYTVSCLGCEGPCRSAAGAFGAGADKTACGVRHRRASRGLVRPNKSGPSAISLRRFSEFTILVAESRLGPSAWLASHLGAQASKQGRGR
jgi:hypothetical protein